MLLHSLAKFYFISLQDREGHKSIKDSQGETGRNGREKWTKSSSSFKIVGVQSHQLWVKYFFKYKFIYFNWRLITLQYCIGFAIHQICHRYTRVPHPETPSHLPPYTIPLGHPSAPAPSILYHASNLDWPIHFIYDIIHV